MTQRGTETRSTGLPSVAVLRVGQSPTGWGSTQERPSPLSKVQPLGPTEEPKNILDFDVETVAAGFADPDWVPQKITCVAWSWVGSDEVQSRICGPAGIFGDPSRRAEMLQPLLDEIAKADMLTGHNIARFDLPVINAECMRLDLEPIRQAVVQDTMKLARSKGFKKGQDNLGRLYGTREEKFALDWQAWQDAYDEDDWATIRKRAESDVVMHKQLRLELLARNYLKPPMKWRA